MIKILSLLSILLLYACSNTSPTNVKTSDNQKVTSIILEVYKEMAIKSLENITLKAKEKWDIKDALIIHRFGELKVHEKIVLVATFASHRKESFESWKFE